MEKLFEFYALSNDPNQLAERISHFERIISSASLLSSSQTPQFIQLQWIPRISQLISSKEYRIVKCGLVMLKLSLAQIPLVCLPYLKSWAADINSNCLTLSINQCNRGVVVDCIRSLADIYMVAAYHGLERDVVNDQMPTTLQLLVRLFSVSSGTVDLESVVECLVECAPSLRDFISTSPSLIRPFEDTISRTIFACILHVSMGECEFVELAKLSAALCNCVVGGKPKIADRHLSVLYSVIGALQSHLDIVMESIDEDDHSRIEISCSSLLKVPEYTSNFILGYPAVVRGINRLVKYLIALLSCRLQVAARVPVVEIFQLIDRVLGRLTHGRCVRREGGDFEKFEVATGLVPRLQSTFLHLLGFAVDGVLGRRALKYRSFVADIMCGLLSVYEQNQTMKSQLYSTLPLLMPHMDKGFVKKVQSAMTQPALKDLKKVFSVLNDHENDQILSIEQLSGSNGKARGKKRKAAALATSETSSLKRQTITKLEFECAVNALKGITRVCQQYGSAVPAKAWKVLDNIVLNCLILYHTNRNIISHSRILRGYHEQFRIHCSEYIRYRVHSTTDGSSLIPLGMNACKWSGNNEILKDLANTIRPRRPYLAEHQAQLLKKYLDGEDVPVVESEEQSKEESEMNETEEEEISMVNSSCQTESPPVKICSSVSIQTDRIEREVIKPQLTITEPLVKVEPAVAIQKPAETTISQPIPVQKEEPAEISDYEDLQDLMIVDADPDL